MTSVTVKTFNIFKVFEHCVKKISIGAQLRFQFTPHWKTIARKKVVLQVMIMPIMNQLITLKIRS